jgi:hypothetical protein
MQGVKPVSSLLALTRAMLGDQTIMKIKTKITIEVAQEGSIVDKLDMAEAVQGRYAKV